MTAVTNHTIDMAGCRGYGRRPVTSVWNSRRALGSVSNNLPPFSMTKTDKSPDDLFPFRVWAMSTDKYCLDVLARDAQQAMKFAEDVDTEYFCHTTGYWDVVKAEKVKQGQAFDPIDPALCEQS